MWVCLRVLKNVVTKGQMRTYHPGDWIAVGRQMAEGWIAAGEAYTLDPSALGDGFEVTSGIALRGAAAADWAEKLTSLTALHLAYYTDGWTPELPFAETLIWTPAFELRYDLVAAGFRLLQRWQVAVPLWDYGTLACQVGTPEERARTEAIIRDLRVPLRDTRLLFVRRCPETRALMDVWGDELAGPDGDERLAFLRALYTVKPLICDLPASWTGRGR